MSGEASASTDTACSALDRSRTPHFVVLQHGVNGSHSDLGLLRRCLEGSTDDDRTSKAAAGNRFVVWDTNVNAGIRSYKGTEKCADALMAELTPALDKFLVESRATLSAGDNAAAGSPLKPRFSIVGHSFGGVLAREVAFRVHQRYREVLHFCTFVSTAAPHLGVRMASHVVSKGGALIGHAFSQTIHELCLNDAKMRLPPPLPPRGSRESTPKPEGAPISADAASTPAADAAPSPVCDHHRHAASAASARRHASAKPGPWDTMEYGGQLASRLIDEEHIAALAAFDARLLVANLTNDHLVPFQTASLLVDAEPAHLRDLVAHAPRVTKHMLPMRKLRKFASEAEARACIGAAHWTTAEGAIVRALRSQLDFDLVPVGVSSRFMRAHPAVVSKWMPFQRHGMDDVSAFVARYIAEHGADVPVSHERKSEGLVGGLEPSTADADVAGVAAACSNAADAADVAAGAAKAAVATH